jgi:hypothetical protein
MARPQRRRSADPEIPEHPGGKARLVRLTMRPSLLQHGRHRGAQIPIIQGLSKDDKKLEVNICFSMVNVKY